MSKTSNRNGPKRMLAGFVAVLAVGGLAVSSMTPATAAQKTKTGKKAVKPKPKVTPAVPADFDVQFVQDAQAVTAGDTATYTLDVLPSKTFQGAVVFDFAANSKE